MRKNNFDIVRLVLAAVVVCVHSADLSASSSLMMMKKVLNSRIAVEGFFAISGFLIFASYERSSSLKEYFSNRAFRILPGYWLSTIICLVIAFSMGEFHVGKWLLANLTFANFLQPSIGSVFALNPTNTAMNGALWTIKIEVMFYVAVPIIVWLCRRLPRDLILWTLFLLSIAYRIALSAHETLSLQLPGQLCFFMIGALIFYHLDFFRKHGVWFMLAAAAGYIAYVRTGWFALRPAPIAALTLGACLLLPQIKGPTRWGDFSYGTYILHYMVIQLVVDAGWFDPHPWAALGLVFAVVAVGAVMSWFFIEKPAMAHSKSRRLRRAALEDVPNYPPAVP